MSEGFLQAVFVEMFGDLRSNPKSLRTALFDDVCAIDAPLVDPRRAEYQTLLHIGGDNIESGTGRLVNLRTAAQDGLISAKFLVSPEHVLFSKIRPKLRKVAEPRMSALCSADIYPVRAVDDSIHPCYLAGFLRSEYFTRIVSAIAESRTSIPKVNRDELGSVAVHLPSMVGQVAFSKVAETHMRHQAVMMVALRQAEHLFQGLLAEAFQSPSPD
jgi:type I restriction enzyme S subunit